MRFTLIVEALIWTDLIFEPAAEGIRFTEVTSNSSELSIKFAGLGLARSTGQAEAALQAVGPVPAAVVAPVFFDYG